MRICHIITSLVYAGAERLLVNTTRLHAERHDIDVIYLKEEPQLAAELDPRIRLHHVPLGRGCAREIRRLLRRWRPDVVHTHLGHADFIGLWAARGLGARTLCTMHNIWFKWDWRDRLIFAGYRWLFRRVVPETIVVCISRSVADHVRGRLGVPVARAPIVHNAIPDLEVTESRQLLRAELDFDADAFAVLFVGRLRVQKSVDTLIDATALLREAIPELVVLIVGDGPDRADLEARAVRLGLGDTVRFCGVTANPERYFAAADVFALPSVFEGFGLVLLEAFRAGLAAVATTIEGPAELIRDGENGLLVEPRRADQLAERLARLHADPALRGKLGAAGRASFQDRFTIARYADALERLYLG